MSQFRHDMQPVFYPIKQNDFKYGCSEVVARNLIEHTLLKLQLVSHPHNVPVSLVLNKILPDICRSQSDVSELRMLS